jgi:acetylornithine deacetylase/succinyl-diaminopimelate desuccinylase-like protein
VPVPDALTRAWEADVVPTLSAYTRLECLSPDYDPDWAAHGLLRQAAELLAEWCRRRAIPRVAVDVVDPPGRTPVLLVEVPASEGAASEGAGSEGVGSEGVGSEGAGSDATVLVYGHLDKQPPQGEWAPGLGPYEPVRRGDHLYGRGTGDDGYAVFAALTGLEWLVGRGVPHPRVVVLIEASEESGSPDLTAHLDALADRIGRPDLVVCLDSGCLTYDRLWVTSSLRGNLTATVRVDVLTEGVHSGVAGGVVPSSFRILRRLLDRLEDPVNGAVRLDAAHCEIPERHRRAAAEVAAAFGDLVGGELPAVDGLVLAGDDAADRLLRRSWGAALAVTGMDGIPAVRDAGNVLRPYTAAKLSLRLPPTADSAAAAEGLVATLTADPPEGAHVSVEVDAPADGWVAPEPAPWVERALEAASQTCFGRSAGWCGEGGSIPFLAELGRRFPGTPLVATGVLGPHSNAHGPNEFLHLPMAQAVSVAVAELVAAAASR